MRHHAIIQCYQTVVRVVSITIEYNNQFRNKCLLHKDEISFKPMSYRTLKSNFKAAVEYSHLLVMKKIISSFRKVI